MRLWGGRTVTASVISRCLSQAVFVLLVAAAGVAAGALGAVAATADEQFAAKLAARTVTREQVINLIVSSAGLTAPDKVNGKIWADAVIDALDRMVDLHKDPKTGKMEKWTRDLTGTMQGLRGHAWNEQEPVDSQMLTNLVYSLRKNGVGVQSMTLCPGTAGQSCNQTPITDNELGLAEGAGNPTAEMNPNRAWHFTEKSGVVFGFASADDNQEQYAWTDDQGNKMTLAATVDAILKQTPREEIVHNAELCLEGTNDSDLETCARMGIRLRLTRAVQR
jgi:hypothetical protein